MANFNINLNKLNELQSSLESAHKNFSGISEQFFSKINKVDTMWNDPNTEIFKKQIKSDKNKIDQYNESAKKINNSISDFLNSLIRVSRQCNSGINGNFSYNGTQAKNVINNCESAYSFIQTSKNKLDYIDIPMNFKYRQRLKNMKYQIMDINNDLKKLTNDLNEVVSSIENAFNNIQNSPKVDTLELKPMSYANQSESVDLISSSHVVDAAKSRQNVNANQSNIDYTEQDSTFQNTSQNQIYNEKHNDFEESDSTFVSQANRETPQEASVIFQEEDSTFQNTSQNQAYSEKTNDFQENESTFKNSEASTSAQNNSINVNNTSNFENNVDAVSYNEQNSDFKKSASSFSNSSKSVSASNNNISFTQTNTEINVPNETSANSNDININVANHFENTAKSVDANDIKVETDKIN